MRVVDPGHEYRLNSLDGDLAQTLTFVKREGPGYPGNVGHHPGTTLQDVLRACIDRLNYVNKQIQSHETELAKEHIEDAIHYLEMRAAERHGRPYMDVPTAVYGETCNKCGHVGCTGECHK